MHAELSATIVLERTSFITIQNNLYIGYYPYLFRISNKKQKMGTLQIRFLSKKNLHLCKIRLKMANS